MLHGSSVRAERTFQTQRWELVLSLITRTGSRGSSSHSSCSADLIFSMKSVSSSQALHPLCHSGAAGTFATFLPPPVCFPAREAGWIQQLFQLLGLQARKFWAWAGLFCLCCLWRSLIKSAWLPPWCRAAPAPTYLRPEAHPGSTYREKCCFHPEPHPVWHFRHIWITEAAALASSQ